MDALATPLRQEFSESPSGPTLALATPEAELLPLDAAERVVVFRAGGKTYRHIFNRLRAADWQNFFANVVAEFKQEKGGFSQVVDIDNASLVLYAKAIKRAEGYRTADGRAPETLPTWPECIPQHHRLAAADLLMRAARSEEREDSIIEAEGMTVTMDALWNEAAPGEMKHYRGLVHHFASPTAEQRRRYLKAKNRAFVAGGSRNGVTIVPSSHVVLVKLYEELIEWTDGYAVGGREVKSRDELVREMDAFHKAAAVGQLFPTSLKTETDEEAAAEQE